MQPGPPSYPDDAAMQADFERAVRLAWAARRAVRRAGGEACPAWDRAMGWERRRAFDLAVWALRHPAEPALAFQAELRMGMPPEAMRFDARAADEAFRAVVLAWAGLAH